MPSSTNHEPPRGHPGAETTNQEAPEMEAGVWSGGEAVEEAGRDQLGSAEEATTGVWEMEEEKTEALEEAETLYHGGGDAIGE
eukprot:1320394-Pyramimonas_sp.AAC.1